MKLHPEDPRLTAYLLGELGPEDSAAVELAVAADPALQAALRETEGVRDILANTFAPAAADQLLASQRATVMQAARQTDLSGKTVPFTTHDRTWKPWLIPLAAAAAVTVGVFAIRYSPVKKSSTVTTVAPSREKPATQSTPPAVAVKEAPVVPAPEKEIPLPHSTGAVAAAESPSLDLPVLSRNQDLSGLIQTIRTERKLPARDRVRLEEILNSFSYRLNGVTAIARAPKPTWHPDNRQEGLTAHTATLATETLPCPWKPSATLLLVSIRGNATDDADAKVVFHPNQKTVFRYHLLGFTASSESSGGKTPTKLAAKSATTLAIEIEPSTATGDLGSIGWTVNGEPATTVSIARSGDNEPSDDARFAALVCAYSQWLAGEQSSMIDGDLLSAFSREITSTSLPADRADFLKLIEESLHL
ncbi:MAG: hypothetical protein ABIT37_17210 [Luteolibacter sp.]